MNTRKGVWLLGIAVALVCCLFLGGCAGYGKHKVQSVKDRELGYRVGQSEVVFRFDPSAYANVTRNDTGEWLTMGRVAITNVSVAGEFNDWGRPLWQMTETRRGVYELRKELSNFGDRRTWKFNFVVNGFYWVARKRYWGTFWVEPPADTPNSARSSYWGTNRSHNLVMTIP